VREDLKVLLDPQDHQEMLAALEILDSLDLLEKLEQQEPWVRGDHLDLRVCKDSLVLQVYQVCPV